MKKFSAPVIYTTVGWIEIEAENKDDARRIAENIDEEGVDYLKIRDACCSSTVEYMELEEIGEKENSVGEV